MDNRKFYAVIYEFQTNDGEWDWMYRYFTFDKFKNPLAAAKTYAKKLLKNNMNLAVVIKEDTEYFNNDIGIWETSENDNTEKLIMENYADDYKRVLGL